jgi:peptidyl-tRNA hydrolase, PTH1 family
VRAIVGIGNPGSRYKNNRHNVGFQFLDHFADKKKLIFKESGFNYFYSEGELSQNPFVLIKPSTYVNLSGVSVLSCINNYNVDIKNVLVIVDDINLELASVRLRKSGGDGGHNGLSSIINQLNSNKFPRIRIGIGNKFENGNLPEYVLSDFSKDDMLKLKYSFELSTQLIESFITDGYEAMLNAYSRFKNLDKNNKETE